METPIYPLNLKEGEKYKIVVYKPMPTRENPYTTVSTTPIRTYYNIEFVKKDLMRVSQLGYTGTTTSSKPLGLGLCRARQSVRDRAQESARQGLQVPVLIFKGQDGIEVKIENSKENKIYSINSTNDNINGNAVIQSNTAQPSQNAGKKKRKTRRKKTKSKKSKKNKSKKNKIKTKKRSKKLK